MARYFFIWNGTRSDEMGIVVDQEAEIVRPEERVEHVTIPGRGGDLTQTEGTDIYNSYIRTVHIAVKGMEAMMRAAQWLTGDGEITFSAQPELKQKARAYGSTTMTKHSARSSWWEGDIQFYCDPYKRLLNEGDSLITESGTAITNPGSMDALPLIVMHGSGSVTLRMGGNSLVIPELTDGWAVDSENKWILGTNGRPVMGAWSGTFPVLPVGESLIQWTGWITSLIITPRWRFL